MDCAQSVSFKNTVGSSFFKWRIVYMELKRQVYHKVVNNYRHFLKILTKPDESSLTNCFIFNN